MAARKNPPLVIRRPGVTIGPGLLPQIPGRPEAPIRALPTAPPGSILVASDDPVIDVIALANTDGVRPTGGGGPRHRVTERILQTSVPVVEGRDPFQISVSLILDGLRTQTRIDSTLENLYQLGDLKPDGTLPTIRLAGLVPARFARRSWEIDGPLQWDSSPDPVAVGDGFYRLPVTVTLIEQVKDQVLQHSIAKSRRGAGAKNAPKFHTVRKGENDLGDVSKAEFGTRSRAAEIARANNIGVGAKLHVGQKLRLP